ncbi:MAG: hypothetical protein LBQ54_15365 [Planctomycetaceae bacterium]|nr:hypothetical protein [Planctomycetaceae bacterium]
MPPAGRDAAAGGNARALHPGRLPAPSVRSPSDRKRLHRRPKAYRGEAACFQ